jgi:hypothetical protein
MARNISVVHMETSLLNKKEWTLFTCQKDLYPQRGLAYIVSSLSKNSFLHFVVTASLIIL